jgi:hypothetical protein
MAMMAVRRKAKAQPLVHGCADADIAMITGFSA